MSKELFRTNPFSGDENLPDENISISSVDKIDKIISTLLKNLKLDSYYQLEFKDHQGQKITIHIENIKENSTRKVQLFVLIKDDDVGDYCDYYFLIDQLDELKNFLKNKGIEEITLVNLALVSTSENSENLQ